MDFYLYATIFISVALVLFIILDGIFDITKCIEKYRIVTDGSLYKIQERFLYLFWADCSDDDGSFVPTVNGNKYTFYSEIDAIRMIVDMNELRKTKKKPYIKLNIDYNLFYEKQKCAENYEYSKCPIAAHEHITCEQCTNRRGCGYGYKKDSK